MDNIASLVLQNSSTIGLGDMTLSTVIGWRSFNSAFGTGSGNKFYYVVRNKDVSNEYEIGIGYLLNSTTLKRDGNQQVLASSNSGFAVNFTAGIKEVICSLPAPLFAAPILPLSVITGRYIHPAGCFGPVSYGQIAIGKLYAVPFIVPQYTEFNRIGCKVIGAVASSTLRLGIFAHDNGPGELVLDADTIDSSTTGDKEKVIDAKLGAGAYWLGVQHEAGASAIGVNWRLCTHQFVGTTGSDSNGGIPQKTNAGALPDPFAADAYVDSEYVPDIWMRKV